MDVVMINKVTEIHHRLSTSQGEDLAKECVEWMRRGVEQDRLARKVEGNRKAGDGWELATLVLCSLLGLAVAWLV